jgi:glutaredoxin
MITVYTKTTCAPCRSLKHWLKVKKVNYIEKNIDESQEILDEMVSNTGMMSVPQIMIGKRVVSGANFSLLSELLMV